MTSPILPQIAEPSVGNPGWNTRFKAVLDRVNQLPEIALDALADRITASGMTVNYDPVARQFTFIGGGGAGTTDLEAVLDFLATNLKVNGGAGSYDDINNILNFVVAGGAAPFPAPSDHGFKAWTFDPVLCSNVQAPTAGQIALFRMDLRDQQTITGLSCRINTTAGAGLSNSFVGLYNAAGIRVALSADQSTAWQSLGEKAPNFSSTAVCPAGAWYGAMLIGAGTTMPTFTRASASTGNSLGLGAPYRFGTFGTGLTALPTTIDLSQVAQSQNAYSFGMR